MGSSKSVETFRWKALTQRTFVGDLLFRDANKTLRAVAEGGWLAVAYPTDRKRAFVESLERAEVTRSFATAPGAGNNPDITVATYLRIESSVGPFEWLAEVGPLFRTDLVPHSATHPLSTTVPGTLTLPNGEEGATKRGTGFFDVDGLLHAYGAWRDAEVEGGWSVITEVSLSAPAEYRPLLGAVPLLLFTTPPI